ncbi:hypothetical protein WR25_11861 [Diploscapter pachys]|uniref:Mitochondrial import receptor subunit TOM20 homolog n=1 Tax=Diploscapter pachys TaxID=2018661 RepID=A0A2A2L1H9_9BILA|nr:hypothetical protein WR25_11861 [Diploscapter pachys]
MVLGMESNKVLIAAGVGAAFIGYCIYFDYKRRSAPDYKQKIRANRRAKAEARAGSSGAGARGQGGLPTNMNDPAAMQAYFLQEVQLGEELMTNGNVEEGAEHIANSILLCGQSQQLLAIFQQTLSPEHFAAVVEKLPTARQRLEQIFGSGVGEGELQQAANTNGDGPPMMAEGLIEDVDDLE